MLFAYYSTRCSKYSESNTNSIGPNTESPGEGSHIKSIASVGEDFKTPNIYSIGLVWNSKSIAPDILWPSLPMLAGGRCKSSGYNNHAASICHDREDIILGDSTACEQNSH